MTGKFRVGSTMAQCCFHSLGINFFYYYGSTFTNVIAVQCGVVKPLDSIANKINARPPGGYKSGSFSIAVKHEFNCIVFARYLFMKFYPDHSSTCCLVLTKSS